MSFSDADLEALIPRLRRYAHALARHPLQPDDLVQDALERAWSRRRQWREGSDLRAWVFAIMHNAFIDQLRRIASRGGDVESTSIIAGLDGPGSPLVVDADSGTRLDLERALAALPEDQRAVVLLVGLEDLGYRDAAEVLGIPIGTVMSRLSRGRARLRVLMDGGSVAGGAPAGTNRTDAVPLQVVR